MESFSTIVKIFGSQNRAFAMRIHNLNGSARLYKIVVRLRKIIQYKNYPKENGIIDHDLQ